MAEPWAHLNGEWLPQARAALPLHDAGFVMGVTVSDLVRTFHGELYRWPEHLARFRAGCKLAHVRVSRTDAQLTAIAMELVGRNLALDGAGPELCLSLFATPGPLGYMKGDPDVGLTGPATLGMTTFPMPFPRYRELIVRGAALVTPSVAQPSPICVPPSLKHRGRIHWWLADYEVAAQFPDARALLLNDRGHVTETAIANFLIVRGNTVTSPRRDTILPGVSLGVVEGLCMEAGLLFEERHLTLDECLTADEALLCGTAFCLAGVRRLNQRDYPFPGPALLSLLALWNREVNLDIHAQIISPTSEPRTQAAQRPE